MRWGCCPGRTPLSEPMDDERAATREGDGAFVASGAQRAASAALNVALGRITAAAFSGSGR